MTSTTTEQLRAELAEADNALAACQSQAAGIIARLTDERDKAIDMVADTGKPLGALSMPQIHRNADVVKALRQREIDANATIATLRAAVVNIRAAAAAGLSYGHQATPKSADDMVARKEDRLRHILRFCEQAGVTGSPLRER